MSINNPSQSDFPEQTPDNPNAKVFDVVLNAFYFFSAELIDLDSLVRVMLASNCPNANVAQGVLNNMVSEGYIGWRRQEGKVCFYRTELGKEKTPPPPPGPIPRTAQDN